MKVKKVVTAVGFVALGISVLSFTSQKASAAEVKNASTVTFNVKKAAC